jgi:hypothetical protein
MRRMQQCHVALRRTPDIELMVGAAGLIEPDAQTLAGGVHAIAGARKPAAGAVYSPRAK